MRLGAIQELARDGMTGHMHFPKLSRDSGIIQVPVKGMQIEQKDSRSDPAPVEQGQRFEPIQSGGRGDNQ
jgi:hypothetical protein